MADPFASGATGEPWLLPRGKVSGLRRGLKIRDGFALTLSDVDVDEDSDCQHVGGEFLKFHYKLQGDSAIGSEKGDIMPVECGQISFLVQPTDSLKRELVRANSHERSVTLICSRDFASSILRKADDNLPRPIDEFLRDRTSALSLLSLPLPPSMRAVVEDILNPPLTNSLRDIMLESKALELLCFTIDQLLKPAGTIVRARDLQKVKELCAFFQENPAAPHGISDLCKLFAWNETQMMECFKQVTGTTISNYRQRIRMDIARRQLQESEASITEIAFDAGYEHPSNFATAFKRTFGFSPKMVRSRHG